MTIDKAKSRTYARKYYREHKAKIRAKARKYRLEHQADRCKYRRKRKAERLTYQSKYQQEQERRAERRAESLVYARKYYQEHRGRNPGGRHANPSLKKYCAWHKKYFGKELFMGQVPAERDGRTDGICADCKKLLEAEMEYPEDASKAQKL